MKRISLVLALAAILCFAVAGTAQAGLWASDWAGNLYDVNTSTAATTFIGATGIDLLGALEFAPDGTLYGISYGSASSLYTIDANTGSASLVGSLGFDFAYEGGLAFGNGKAYGVNASGINGGELFQLNLTTGAASVIGTMGANVDVNGLSWRSDGILVGIEDFSGDYVAIDPVTGAIFDNAASGFVPGSVGGMAIYDEANGYGWVASGATGSNSLYTFDQFSGTTTGFVGTFGGVRSGTGISGLAASAVPEPGTLALFGFGLASAAGAIRRKRAAKKA